MESQDMTKEEENNSEKKSQIMTSANETGSAATEDSVYLEGDEQNQTNEVPSTKKTIQKTGVRKKKYHSIPNEIRLKLINAVENKGEKIKHVAKRLCINYSSAKSICQVFKREGRMDKKAFKRRGAKEDSSTKDKTDSTMDPGSQGPLISTQGIQPMLENDQNQGFENSNNQKDTLVALRDRLLEAKNNSLKKNSAFDPQLQNTEEVIDYSSQIDQPVPEFNKPLQQLDRVIAHNTQMLMVNQQQQLSQPQQQKIVVMNSQPANKYPQAYIVPPQNMGPIIINTPQPVVQPTYGMYYTQPIHSAPVQTININQPQAKNMTIQNVTSTENHSNQSSNQIYQYNEMNTHTHVMQPPLVVMNPTIIPQHQINGYQPQQYMQPIIYVVPQTNNMQFAMPQYTSHDIHYTVPQQSMVNTNFIKYNPMDSTKLRPSQTPINNGEGRNYSLNPEKQQLTDETYQANKEENKMN